MQKNLIADFLLQQRLRKRPKQLKGDGAGAHPVLTKMELTFNETEIMTKETIAAGH